MRLFDAFGAILDKTPIGKVADRLIDQFLPEKLTEAEREQFKAALAEADHQRKMDLLQAANEQEAAFNKRVKDMEGTASDLKTIPIIGAAVIFARGAQRPIWGFATLWADMHWFIGEFGQMTDRQEVALIVINTLVLGFLFGERTIKNLAPLITQVFGKGGK